MACGCVTPAGRGGQRVLLELLDGQPVVDIDNRQIGEIEGAA